MTANAVYFKTSESTQQNKNYANQNKIPFSKFEKCGNFLNVMYFFK